MSCQLALAAVFGILFAEGAGWQYALCMAALACVLLLPLLCERSFRECAVRAAMLLLAGALAAGSFLVQDERWHRQEKLLRGGQQVIRGVVAHREQKNDRWQVTLSLPDHGNQVLVSMEECAYPLDSVLLVKGTIETFGFPRNEGQFNEKTYYRSRQVIGRMRAQEVVCVRVPRGVGLWREWLYSLRTMIARVCAQMLPEAEAGILAAMLAGEKSLLDGKVYALFQRAGISHILAISGMHVSMIGMGIYALLRKCRGSYVLCAGLTAVLLFGYGTMAGFGVSTKRAFAMFAVYLLAQCVGRGYDARAALGAAAFALLLYRPFLLHSLSFQFSFAAAYAVVAIGDLLKERDMAKRQRECDAQEKQRDAGRMQRRLLRVRSKAAFGAVPKAAFETVSKAASGADPKVAFGIASMAESVLHAAGRPFCAAFLLQLCILPLMAYYDYELPLCALFLNLLLLPYAGVVMGFGILGCALALAGIYGAQLLFVPCKMVLSVYIWACLVAEGLPFSSVVCGRPPEGKLWVYYGCLFALFFALGRRKRGSGPPSGACLGTLLCGAALLAFLCHVPRGGFELSFLDVGQGDGSFLRTAEGVTCFVDGGSSDVFGLGSYRILPFLKSKGVRRVDYWLLSHLDEDHVSGFYEVMDEGFAVGAVVVAEGCVRDDAWERLAGTLERCGVPLICVRAGDVMPLRYPADIFLQTQGVDCVQMQRGVLGQAQGGACLRFLAPDASADASDRNAASLVFLYEEAGFHALWTGDIGAKQEEELLSDWRLSGKVRAGIDVYKAAHHGSDYSNSSEFLRALAPRLSAVSCGKKNRYGHPGETAVFNMQAAGGRVLATMDCGQIKVTRRGGAYAVVTAENFWQEK